MKVKTSVTLIFFSLSFLLSQNLNLNSSSNTILTSASTSNLTTDDSISISSSSDSNSFINEASVVSSKTNFTHLERYRLNTKEHFLRRSEIIFFISIPFTLLWSTFLIDRFRDFSVVGAYFDGVRGGQLRSSNFVYSHDNFPSRVVDPFYLFKWISATIWPLTIASNDFIERGLDPVTIRDFKKQLKENRFKLNLINQPNF